MTPDQLPEEIKHALKHLLGECDEQKKPWAHVATLNGDALLAWKTFQTDNSKARRDVELLIAQIRTLSATMEQKKAETWARIEIALGLPHEANYEIKGDKVLMRPKSDE